MNKSLIFIIDTSYSVTHILENYIRSINNIIDVQLSLNPSTKFSIITFNTRENYICINEVIGNTKRRITRDDLKPTGFTALYDSVSAILIHLNNFYKVNNSEPPLVIILTDGDDTASKLLTRKHLFLQISRNKARGWKFIYLGVTENSLQLGRDIGSDISILYNTSEDCFTFLPNVFKELFSKPIISNVQIDLNEIMENMKNLKI